MTERITAAAELDALPVGSVVRTTDGDIWQKCSTGEVGAWDCLTEDGRGGRYGHSVVIYATLEGLPTVLYRPDAEPVSVLPSVEAVARAIDPELWRYYDTGILPPTHHGTLAVVRKSKEAAERVLALLPGRTEAEVKAEAWDEMREV